MEDWLDKKEFREACFENHLEYRVLGENRIKFFCSKAPDPSLKKKIISHLPKGWKSVFEECPRQSTINTINSLIDELRMGMSVTSSKRGIEIHLHPPTHVEFPSDLINSLAQIIQSDHYYDRVTIKVNAKIVYGFDRKIADLLASQSGDRPINNDDLLNLKITLETCQTVEDFINSI